jgi:hypothetical protein
MALHISVFITDGGGTLEEEIDALNRPVLKGKKTRGLKQEYKAAMKNPANYSTTFMADPTHTPLFMRPNGGSSDDVTFYFSQAFTVSFGRDPEIDEDFSSPDVPFINTVTGTADASVNAVANPGAPAGQEFKAGPFRLNSNCQAQKFYKFTVDSPGFPQLDPDIILGN